MPGRDLAARLEENSIPEPNSGCYLWLGRLTPKGYGELSVYGQTTRAHIAAYELKYGLVPYRLILDHKCRVRCCINPDHLEPVTIGGNIRRGLTGEATRKRQLAKTHCPRGHPYSGDNLYIIPKSRARGCLACKRIRRPGEWEKRKMRRMVCGQVP